MTAEPQQRAYDLSGTELEGRYRLVRLIGAGGMGSVYEAEHILLDTQVAVKVLKLDLCANEKFRKRFLREARAASKIRHSHVVRITDFGTTPSGLVYFVMERLFGQDLEALLDADGRLPWGVFRPICLQTIKALSAAHSKGVVHRDIKPANIFLAEQEGAPHFVKVLDFGIAKLTADEADGLTGTDELFGTVSYMAPELAEGGQASPRSDTYSLGVLMYEALTGQVPFAEGTPFQILAKHLNEDPVPPREHVPEIPLEVEAVILEMMAKDPEQRPASLRDVLERLVAIPEGAPDTSASEARAPKRNSGAITGKTQVTVMPPIPARLLASPEEPSPPFQEVPEPTSAGTSSPPIVEGDAAPVPRRRTGTEPTPMPPTNLGTSSDPDRATGRRAVLDAEGEPPSGEGGSHTTIRRVSPAQDEASGHSAPTEPLRAVPDALEPPTRHDPAAPAKRDDHPTTSPHALEDGRAPDQDQALAGAHDPVEAEAALHTAVAEGVGAPEGPTTAPFARDPAARTDDQVYRSPREDPSPAPRVHVDSTHGTDAGGAPQHDPDTATAELRPQPAIVEPAATPIPHAEHQPASSSPAQSIVVSGEISAAREVTGAVHDATSPDDGDGNPSPEDPSRAALPSETRASPAKLEDAALADDFERAVRGRRRIGLSMGLLVAALVVAGLAYSLWRGATGGSEPSRDTLYDAESSPPAQRAVIAISPLQDDIPGEPSKGDDDDLGTASPEGSSSGANEPPEEPELGTKHQGAKRTRRPRRLEAEDHSAINCTLNPSAPGCKTPEELGPPAPPPDKLSTADIKAGFARQKRAAKKCGSFFAARPGERVVVKLSIDGSSGAVTSATPLFPHSLTELGKCVADELSQAKFRRFTSKAQGVQFGVTM